MTESSKAVEMTWRHTGEIDRDSRATGTYTTTVDGETFVAIVYGIGREECIERARLIAKAPEMAELLRELWGWSRIVGNSDVLNPKPLATEDIRKIRTVAERAERLLAEIEGAQ